MEIYMTNCVSCGNKTQGKCGDDPVCYDCYVQGVYADWLKSVGRGDELVCGGDEFLPDEFK